MKKLQQFNIAFLFLFVIPECMSQTNAGISKPVVELQDNGQVRITYGIENVKKDEAFTVWIEITDSNGRSILLALTGDIGHRIKGGAGKVITWNLGLMVLAWKTALLSRFMPNWRVLQRLKIRVSRLAKQRISALPIL